MCYYFIRFTLLTVFARGLLVLSAAKPRMNLIRFHGVLAPNSKYRKEVTGYDRSNIDLINLSTKQALTMYQNVKND